MSTQKTMLKIGGHSFPATNLGKVLFPKDGITKRDVIEYYKFIAPYMLPHIKGRALSLQRYPDGIEAFGFFQRNIGDYFPDWIGRVTLKLESGSLTSVVCDNPACLAYLGSQAALVIHTHLAPVKHPRVPDEIIWDLDPGGEDFEAVRRAALELRAMLVKRGLKPLVKLTGSRGVHVVAAVKGAKSFEQTRAFANEVARELVDNAPHERTLEQRKAKRKGRLYIDTGRNAYTATAVAPYSIRAKPGAPVAAPVTWTELKSRKTGPRSFNIGNIRARIKAKGDLWKDFKRSARPLTAAIKKPG